MASTVLPNGIIVPEKFSRDWYADLYHNWQELDNLLGGGTPKDGTLTIQQNGTAVDTFTANSSSDKTVNIQCVDLTSNQTVGGDKEFTGTTTAHDVIPSATDTYNFGSSSYQWNNAYIKSLTINGVACGDILTHNASEFASKATTLNGYGITDAYTKTQVDNKISGLVNSAPETLDTLNELASALGNDPNFATTVANQIGTKANDSDVVHKYGDEGISGLKSFYDVGRYYIDTSTKSNNFLNFKALNIELDSETNLPTKNYTFSQNITSANPALYLGNYYSIATQGITGTDIRNYKYGSNIDWAGISIRYDLNDDSVISVNCNSFRPKANNTTVLGTSTNKWKSFNGINPGALSLPSNSYVNIDTTNWDLTCQNELMGSFTPTADGWLMLHVANSGTNEVNFWIIGEVIRINNKSTLNTSDNKNFNMITIPVEKDKTYNIYGNASEYVAGRSIGYCKFMPCQGNV